MDFISFLTKRLRSSKNAEFSRPAIRIAVISVALSIAVMIVSVAIVKGFQQEIRDKVSGFAGNIQITSYDFNSSYEFQPIQIDLSTQKMLKALPGIKSMHALVQKAGIIKTDDQLEGIVMKGVEADYNWTFYQKCLVEGKIPDFKDTADYAAALISTTTASRLHLKLHDPLRVYFVNQGIDMPRGRKLKIVGIYESGMEEFDKLYVVANIGLVRKLNLWDSLQAGSYELYVENMDLLPQISEQVNSLIPSMLNAVTVMELYPHIFDWLSLLDANVYILLILMVIVSAVSMISALLILVMERTSMIGILKAMGAGNRSIQVLFLRLSASILGRGMIAGNIFGLGLVFLQHKFSFIRLPQESYYVSHVPVYINVYQILLVNAGTFALCLLILLIPAFLLTRVSPLRAIRFD